MKNYTPMNANISLHDEKVEMVVLHDTAFSIIFENNQGRTVLDLTIPFILWPLIMAAVREALDEARTGLAARARQIPSGE